MEIFDRLKAKGILEARVGFRGKNGDIERVFGITITNSQGRQVPVRLIGEQHVREDLGFIPSVEEWFQHIQLQPWMHRGVDRKVNSLSLEDLKVSSEG